MLLSQLCHQRKRENKPAKEENTQPEDMNFFLLHYIHATPELRSTSCKKKERKKKTQKSKLFSKSEWVHKDQNSWKNILNFSHLGAEGCYLISMSVWNMCITYPCILYVCASVCSCCGKTLIDNQCAGSTSPPCVTRAHWIQVVLITAQWVLRTEELPAVTDGKTRFLGWRVCSLNWDFEGFITTMNGRLNM